MPLYGTLIIVLLLSALVMAVAVAAYRWPALKGRRIFDDRGRKVVGTKLYARVALNMGFSGVLVFVLAYAGYPLLFHHDDTAWWQSPLQAVLILGLYDFTYYLMHRFAFHQWPWLKRVHAVHHAVRHPHALDSLYLHPLETFLGLALLMLCIYVVGPITIPTFGVVFATYSLLNILVHAGLDLPFFPFKALSYLAKKHDLHHTSMRGGNFASITPIWDRLFGTAE